MPLDLVQLAARRQPKGQREPLRLSAPAPMTSAAQELAAAANALCIALADKKVCPVCGGASYLGKHTVECPIPEIEKAILKQPCLSTEKLLVEVNTVVRRDSEGAVSVHTIPWNRWIYLNPAQRIDVMSRKHNKLRATRITCRFCDSKTFVITPLRNGHRIDECWDCWSVRSRDIEGIRLAAKEALAKARWSRAQTKTRAIHRILARSHAKRAKANATILKEALAERP